MNIKDLKELIADLPDEMPVVNCHEGGVGSFTDEVDLSVRDVYKFDWVWNYGIKKGTTYEVEFCEVYNGATPKQQYRALVFYTGE